MRLAIDEAKKGLGYVAPNPPVGCAILDSQGGLLATGYHHQFGDDHAEIDALKKIADPALLTGATLFVTLEPCAHEGKTPSCAKKLATLPIQKVIYGLVDPNPLVSGQGLEILQKAKISVQKIEGLDVELENLAEHFLFNKRTNRTFVSLKVATSLDGQMAHSSGESKWITGERAREEAHYLRALHDAVLIGSRTFLFDNPTLNVRHSKFIEKKNKVIVMDSSGQAWPRLPQSQLLRGHSPTDIIWVLGERAAPEIEAEAKALGGIHIWRFEGDKNSQARLAAMLERAYDFGIMSILVEGGAQIISSFLQAALAQRYYQFIANQLVGAKSGLSVTRDLNIQSWASRLRLLNTQMIQLGEDILITGRLPEPSSPSLNS